MAKETTGGVANGRELSDAALDAASGGVVEIAEMYINTPIHSSTGNALIDAFLGGFYGAGGR